LANPQLRTRGANDGNIVAYRREPCQRRRARLGFRARIPARMDRAGRSKSPCGEAVLPACFLAQQSPMSRSTGYHE